MRMSSKYTTTKELVKGLNTSSINLMKVVGAFVKPKGMTSHFVETFFRLEGCLPDISWFDGNLVVARIQVNLVEEIFPLELVKKVINHGNGVAFLTVILFKDL
jgi:hypothetical protein